MSLIIWNHLCGEPQRITNCSLLRSFLSRIIKHRSKNLNSLVIYLRVTLYLQKLTQLQTAKKIASLLLVLSGLLPLSFSQKQDYFFRHLTVEDGLASNIVSAIMQDNSGYIWFATENGLQRYDGYSFISYHHNPSDPLTITEDRISALFEGPENSLWVKTHSLGFLLFNKATGRKIDLANQQSKLAQDLFAAGNAFLDKNKDIWFYSGNGMLSGFDQTHKIEIADRYSAARLHLPLIEKMGLDPVSGKLWIATRKGVACFDPNNNVLYDFHNNPRKLPIFGIQESVNQLFIDRKDNIWVSTPGYKLYRFNQEYKILKEYSNSVSSDSKTKRRNYQVDQFLQDRSGMIWMGGHDGLQPALLVYDPRKDSLIAIKPDPSYPDGFQCSYGIFSLCEDREGNIWIGTDKGINIINPRQHFFSVSHNPKDPVSFPRNEVTNFLEQSNGDIWASTWGGGTVVMDSTLAIKKRFFDKSSVGFYATRHDGNLAWSLLEDTSGKVWIGCQHAYLSIYDPGTKKISNSRPRELGQKTIKNMAIDKDKHIWLALHTAIARWDAQKNRFITYDQFIPYKGSSATIVSDIIVDADNNVWVATENLGLQKFNPVSEKFEEMYVPEGKMPFAISASVINSFCLVNDSIIAVGTGGGGINIFNSRSKKFWHITTAQGLPSNDITAIYKQSANLLWVTARNALSRVDLKSMRVVNYGREDGIANTEFASSSRLCRLRDGRMLAGTTNGFVCFNPDSIRENEIPPDPRITGFRVLDINMSTDSILKNKQHVWLRHDQNFFTIGFASISFLSPGQTLYYYMLEGVDKDWVKAGNQRFAAYTDIKPGRYLFKVKCENRNGIASKGITCLEIHIIPPFWEAWWFMSLSVAALIAILYSLYRYRIGQLLKLQEMRNRISRDLHDDIGSALSSINIYSEVAKKNLGNREIDAGVIPILNKITESSAHAMENMQDIVWSINPGNDDLETITVRMQVLAAQVLESKNIRLEFLTEFTTAAIALGLEKRRDLLMIFKEAINNITKYSQATNASVIFRLDRKKLFMKIEDDGIGFDMGAVRKGNGLRNIRERVANSGGSVEIVTKPGEGTRIELCIPV